MELLCHYFLANLLVVISMLWAILMEWKLVLNLRVHSMVLFEMGSLRVSIFIPWQTSELCGVLWETFLYIVILACGELMSYYLAIIAFLQVMEASILYEKVKLIRLKYFEFLCAIICVWALCGLPFLGLDVLLLVENSSKDVGHYYEVIMWVVSVVLVRKCCSDYDVLELL